MGKVKGIPFGDIKNRLLDSPNVNEISIVLPDTAQLVAWLPRQYQHIGRPWKRCEDLFPQMEKNDYLNWWNERWGRWDRLYTPHRRLIGLVQRMMAAHELCNQLMSAVEIMLGHQLQMRKYTMPDDDSCRLVKLTDASRGLRKVEYQVLGMLERLQTLSKTIRWLELNLNRGAPIKFYRSVYDTCKTMAGEYFITHTHSGRVALLRQLDDVLKKPQRSRELKRLIIEYREIDNLRSSYKVLRERLMEQREALTPLHYVVMQETEALRNCIDDFELMKSRLKLDECTEDMLPLNINDAIVAASEGGGFVVVQFLSGVRAKLPTRNIYRFKTFKKTDTRRIQITPTFVHFPEINVTFHADEFLDQYGEPIFPVSRKRDRLVGFEEAERLEALRDGKPEPQLSHREFIDVRKDDI